MEGILIFLAIFVGIPLIRVLFRAFFSGDDPHQFMREPTNMKDFSIQVKKKPAGDDVPFERYEVLGQGLFPNKNKTQLTFVTQLLDVTDKDEKPKHVISSTERFQSGESPVFVDERIGPEVEGGFGLIKPTVIGIIIQDILVPPKSGSRNISVILTIKDGNDDVLERYSDTVKLLFYEKGYEEAYETREEAFTLDIQLAVFLAFSDNEFHETEGALIKNWMTTTLEYFNDEDKERVKERFNKNFKKSFEQAKEGKLSLSKITKRLNEIGDDRLKYQAIELCLDVMAADGIADEGELEAIRKICDSLELDFDEVQKLKDVRLKDLKMRVTEGTSLEELIGIKPDWDNDKIKKHIRNEFKKWNSRLTSSKNEDERNNAQEKLNLIAELRKRYG